MLLAHDLSSEKPAFAEQCRRFLLREIKIGFDTPDLVGTAKYKRNACVQLVRNPIKDWIGSVSGRATGLFDDEADWCAFVDQS